MKAAVYADYGPPGQVLRIEEVDQPRPRRNEVLIRVHASSVTFNVLGLLRGRPYLGRLISGGLFKPKYRIVGTDVAGRVEAVGGAVTELQPQDDVFGDMDTCGYGAFAEYVCASEDAVALKPTSLSYEDAAAVPQSALVALQALRDRGRIESGQRVLIYGASGGIGTFAVQLARSFGAEVTGVCGPRNVEMVRSIGAKYVVDYTQEDFARTGTRYDLIVATAGYCSIFDYRRALTPHGTYVATGGSMRGPHAMTQVYQALLLGPLISRIGSQRMCMLTLKPSGQDLAFLREMIDDGKVKPVVDRRYTLEHVVEALEYYERGHAQGKVVITI